MMLSYRKVLVSGIVQGVGFRPFCARMALEMGANGSVRNTSEGVVIELEGDVALLEEYLRRIEREQPDAAAVTSIEILEEEIPRVKRVFSRFSIERSIRQDEQRVLIPPDIATCDDCLRELDDPHDRRFQYPFINCTNCGPRYTIIRDLPYDRPSTTMSRFELCASCRDEYEDPHNRRFHAQPNACPECGPSVTLTDAAENLLSHGTKALEMLADRLRRGAIAAIKGLGGFHLACDAYSDASVGLLRLRKHRPHKPFALMVADEAAAESLVILSHSARRALTGSRRPIVLCPSRSCDSVSSLVAPGQDTIGIMLPYTPLHHLIMRNFRALVMTSANMSEAPIISDNTQAMDRLATIADVFLMHNRDIHMPIDDSVVVPYRRNSFPVRRARGFVPSPVVIPFRAPVIVGAGGEMKATFAVSQRNLVFPSQYLGDLKQVETIEFYRRALAHLLRLYNFHPRFFVHDRHPQYLSTKAAIEAFSPLPEAVMAVQHHYAHMAACMIDNRVEDDVIGVIFDGTGYGDDGTIWGGEFLVGNLKEYRRVGSLYPARLPGGEKAILEPWRYAISLLSECYDARTAISLATSLWPERSVLSRSITKALPFSPETTSCGRLFDGVSAILGIRDTISYDGQAAMELEALAGGRLSAPFDITRRGGFRHLDWRPAIRWIVERLDAPDRRALSGGFHRGLARSVAEICDLISHETGIRKIALSGGVWQNKRLLTLTEGLLRIMKLTPLIHRSLSPNDECVSVGQVAIGAAKWSQ
jgi:hydrogenase maturation protein HypF